MTSLDNPNQLRLKNHYKIPLNILGLTFLFCLFPFILISVGQINSNYSSVYFGEINIRFFSVIWTVIGISASIFTGILAIIDFKIRYDILSALFGIILIASGIFDCYYLFMIGNSYAKTFNPEELFSIWHINRFFYTIVLFLGSYYFVKIPKKLIRTDEQKRTIVYKSTLIIAFVLIICLLLSIFLDNHSLAYKLNLWNIQVDLISYIPIILWLIWILLVMPKLLKRFYGIFPKLLTLSIIPLIFAQLFISFSHSAFNSEFNISHYFKLLGYLIPIIGIALSYIKIVKNENETLYKLDLEIKENKRLNKSLQLREALLTNAEQISNLGSWELDITNNSYKWSDQLYKIYGFDNHNFQPTHAILEQLIDSAYTKKLNKELAYAVRNKTTFAVEYQINRFDGAKRFVLGQGYFDADDKKLIGTIQDITELKEATLKLKNNESLLREAEAISHNGSWEWNNQLQQFFWSDEMCNIHGILPYSRHINLISYLDFVHPEDRQSLENAFKEAKINHAVFTLDYRIIRPNQDIRHVITRAKFKKNENDEHYVIIGNTQDVTILRETERLLEEKINELNMSNKELEQFAYVASHDLQEPLRKIRAFGDRLSSKYSEKLDAEGQDYIQRMQNAAERMQTLIDDLLAFSRATRDNKAFEAVDLNQLIGRILNDLDFTIESAEAQVNFKVDAEVDGVAGQLAQVFQNLISNALKFVKADVKPVVDIYSETHTAEELGLTELTSIPQFTIITIKDNGIGFDEAYKEKIFDLFQRLHTRDEYKGTGIGLAICKKIVENHHGYIKVNSKEGEGAEFKIILPIHQNQ